MILRKLRIYLDTSVISYLYAMDAYEKMSDTLLLWEDIKDGKYDVRLSEITTAEINSCPEPKKELLLNYIRQIDFEPIFENDESIQLANEYIKHNVLTKKSFDDARHIACAIINNCDIIVSWNFKHLVNHRTISGVKGVNALDGYREISIYSPSMLLEGDE